MHFYYSDTTNLEIQIKLPLDVQPGTVMMPEPGFILKYIDGNGEEDAVTGNIIIFEYQAAIKRVKGTFSFQTATKNISLGQFNVFYE